MATITPRRAAPSIRAQIVRTRSKPGWMMSCARTENWTRCVMRVAAAPTCKPAERAMQGEKRRMTCARSGLWNTRSESQGAARKRANPRMAPPASAAPSA